jgi:hypothetical protein
MKYEKVCEYCGTHFTPKRNDARFCSNSCRSLNNRKVNGIPDPSFLNKGMGNVPNQERIIKKENPEWIKLNNELKKFTSLKDEVENQKIQIVKQLSQLSIKWETTFIGALGGALIGAGLGGLSDDPKKGERVGALIGSGIGGVAGYAIGENLSEKQRDKVNLLNIELINLDKYINSYSVLIESIKIKLNKIPRIVKIRVENEVNPNVKVNTGSMEIRPLESVLRGNAVTLEKKEKAKVMTASEVAVKEYNMWNLGCYTDFLGSPEYGFSALVTGIAGQGKSTFSLKLAGYLAKNLGKVLFISSEEGQRMTMQNKIKILQIESDNLHIAECKSKKNLDELLFEYSTPFVFIDSINHLGISADELEKLKERYPTRSFITIQQANKDGSYKGNSAFGHNTDIIIEVSEGKAVTTKNRFNETNKHISIYE